MPPQRIADVIRGFRASRGQRPDHGRRPGAVRASVATMRPGRTEGPAPVRDAHHEPQTGTTWLGHRRVRAEPRRLTLARGTFVREGVAGANTTVESAARTDGFAGVAPTSPGTPAGPPRHGFQSGLTMYSGFGLRPVSPLRSTLTGRT